MPIESINSLASPVATPKSEASRSDNEQIGRDAFMKLLVAQLQNQDPLDPMEARDMVTQLSQLTGVEHLQTIESRIGSLEIATAGMANTQVAQLVGKEVRAEAKRMWVGETGTANAAYQLESRANGVTATIRDASGQTVRTIELGDQSPGAHAFEWDGANNSGERVRTGRYTVEFSAKDASGNPIEVKTEIKGEVTGISFEHGYPELIIGEARIMLGDVIEIEQKGKEE